MSNYAKEGEVKIGTVLIADDGFTCIPSGAELTVKGGPGGEHVKCREGNHYIDSALNRRKEYVGFRLKTAS